MSCIIIIKMRTAKIELVFIMHEEQRQTLHGSWFSYFSQPQGTHWYHILPIFTNERLNKSSPVF